MSGSSAIIRSLELPTGLPFVATATGETGSPIRQPDGSLFIRASVAGHSNPLGDFTGSFQIRVPPNGPPIVVQAFLKLAEGSPVSLTITLTDMPGAQSREGGPQMFEGKFVIHPGPGKYAHPGCGTAFVRVGEVPNTFSIVIKGAYEELPI
jgi:hypothetical protein